MEPKGTYPLPIKNSDKNRMLIVLGGLLVLSLIFGVLAFNSREQYKKTATADSIAATSAITKQQAAQKALGTATKQPYKTYSSSSTYGSISFNYPKSYSAYVDETGTDEPVNGYFYPGQVPGIQSKTAFALRVELVSTSYSDIMSTFSSSIQSGTVKASAYVPPKLKGVNNVQPGTKLDGQISNNGQTISGSMVVIPVRDKTLEIYTQSSSNFGADFNSVVLPSLTFVP